MLTEWLTFHIYFHLCTCSLLTVGLYFELKSNTRWNCSISFNEYNHVTLKETQTHRRKLAMLGHNTRAAKKHVSRSEASAAKEMRSVSFWDVTQQEVVIPYRFFGAIQELNFLTLDSGTDGLSRKVGKKLTIIYCVISQKSTDFKTLSDWISLKILLKSDSCFLNTKQHKTDFRFYMIFQ